MHFILGALALLGLGLIGLLIETHKQDKFYIAELMASNSIQASYAESLEFQIENTEKHVANLDEMIASLVSNQKPIPWNKGKKGYKLTRKPKLAQLRSTEQALEEWKESGNKLFTPRMD